MTYTFDPLFEQLANYRNSADRLFDAPLLSQGEETSQYFFALQMATASLYLHYLIFRQALPALYAVASRENDERLSSGSIQREMEHRRRYGEAVEALPWHAFRPTSLAFSELQTVEDYQNSLKLHVPEIYEESLQMTEAILHLRTQLTSQGLTAMEIGMEHLCNNHAMFLMPALQWLGHDSVWEE